LFEDAEVREENDEVIVGVDPLANAGPEELFSTVVVGIVVVGLTPLEPKDASRDMKDGSEAATIS
jgi:hypothetical protein